MRCSASVHDAASTVYQSLTSDAGVLDVSGELHIFCARTTSMMAAAAVTGSSSLMSWSSVSSAPRTLY
jgi:hypothetical protein